MRPFLRQAALAVACVSALALAGCGKQVATNAPITYAPADTPFLFANFKGTPADVRQAWNPNQSGGVQSSFAAIDTYAKLAARSNPTLAKVLEAIHAELANVKTEQEFADAVGLSPSALFAVYGIGDVPVARMQLASGDKFKAFWARVEKRAGVATATGTVGTQSYFDVGDADAKLHLLVAIEGNQLVLTGAPAHASEPLLKQLLGIDKPSSNAADRLAGINREHGYSDVGSGFIDLPRLFANIFADKGGATSEFARELGASDLDNPACASEFDALANQAPLASFGYQTFTASELQMSLDVKLAPSLLGALTALKQPIPGMAAKSGDAVLDVALALPLQKWQAFLKDRAEAAAASAYQCPALQSLNRFAATASNPPMAMPPEAASLEGVRLILDKWEAGPQLAGRLLVASSNPAELAQKIQSMPMFAMKTLATDGKPVAFDLPPGAQAMFGGATQGYVAANASALVAGFGAGEDAKLGDALTAAAGNGDTLFRLHSDGRIYAQVAGWMQRLATRLPSASPAQTQHTIDMMQNWSRLVKSQDFDVRLDANGLHFEGTTIHQ